MPTIFRCECMHPRCNKEIDTEGFIKAMDWITDNGKSHSELDVRSANCPSVKPETIVFQTGSVVVVNDPKG